MNQPFNGPLPNLAYLRLFEYQKQRKLYPTYTVDLPLLLFIFFSRIAAGLSIMPAFFPSSMTWMAIAFSCMVLATGASVTHLTVPGRFLTMIINHRSPLVWEIRLAGALAASLGGQLLSRMGMLGGFEEFFLWSSVTLSIFFLVSTGWAYRFHTHPAWRTHLLPGYYLASASITGFSLYSIVYPTPFFAVITLALLCTEGLFIFLYLNHLRRMSPVSLKRIGSGKDRGISFAFLASAFVLPGLLALAAFFTGGLAPVAAALAVSNGAGIVLERILFFRLEQPFFFRLTER